MNEFNYLIKNYSIKNVKRIRDICSPLRNFGIEHFTYYYVEEDGAFGTLTNNLDHIDHYYSNGYHLNNPFMSHPSLFRSGIMYCPCTFKEEWQEIVKRRTNRDHIYLKIESQPGLVEGYCFSDSQFDISKLPNYLPWTNELTKFAHYFKKELADLLKKIRSEGFNMKKCRGEDFFKTPQNIPLVSNDPKVKDLLDNIWGLSPQELRCLEYFKLGHSAQATAAKMNLSQRTVEHYIDSVKDKLNCSSKWELLNI